MQEVEFLSSFPNMHLRKTFSNFFIKNIKSKEAAYFILYIFRIHLAKAKKEYLNC